MVSLTISNKKYQLKHCLNLWILVTIILSGILFSPILAVFAAAAGDSSGLWSHLFQTVLPRYISNTLVLMIGVALVSLVFGVYSAWIVVRFDFFGRSLFQWILLMPAAVPAYLIAYTYTDFLEYAGPVQNSLREIFNWHSARDYWFPNIRSMGGAMLVMGSVLYPYVYVMARASFMLTPASYYEVGMLSMRNPFWKIALPLARPAIAAGLALVLMETLSDFGTVEYFAIETLTLGIFNVWLGMNNLTAAAQIAALTFLFIIALLSCELIARARRRFTDTTNRSTTLTPIVVKGFAGLKCWIICCIPIIIGFLIPVGVLIGFVFKGHSIELTDKVISASFNSLALATSVACLVMLLVAFLVLVAKYQGHKILQRVVAIACIGYAFPGTILAIGVVTAAGAVDNCISTIMHNYFSISYDGWLTSGIGLIVLACAVRFQAVGYGALTSGLERLPPNMMNANLTLGHSFRHGLQHVILPLIGLSFAAGGLLVFVDVMKELPMTLLLRPFDFETLPTYVYQFAKDELLEEAALPALLIIATGIIPVVYMNVILNKYTRV